ncbi:hypothetical protein HDV00_009349, partial [Rhizophlyctis rosea]
ERVKRQLTVWDNVEEEYERRLRDFATDEIVTPKFDRNGKRISLDKVALNAYRYDASGRPAIAEFGFGFDTPRCARMLKVLPDGDELWSGLDAAAISKHRDTCNILRLDRHAYNHKCGSRYLHHNDDEIWNVFAAGKSLCLILAADSLPYLDRLEVAIQAHIATASSLSAQGMVVSRTPSQGQPNQGQPSQGQSSQGQHAQLALVPLPDTNGATAAGVAPAAESVDETSSATGFVTSSRGPHSEVTINAQNDAPAPDVTPSAQNANRSSSANTSTPTNPSTPIGGKKTSPTSGHNLLQEFEKRVSSRGGEMTVEDMRSFLQDVIETSESRVDDTLTPAGDNARAGLTPDGSQVSSNGDIVMPKFKEPSSGDGEAGTRVVGLVGRCLRSIRSLVGVGEKGQKRKADEAFEGGGGGALREGVRGAVLEC